ncbi:hypothetical protein MKW92_037258 [Papaver armeniacum]|nr:hypothetical protein MKW92_037258 [Papaver armeniacum]
MEGGAGAVVMTPTNNSSKSLIAQLQNGVETVVVTTTHALPAAAYGAAFGVLVGSVLKIFPPFQGIVGLQARLARDFAVWRGTNQGMICALKRIRGKDDIKARAVAGFTSGYMFHVVGNPSPNRASQATISGLIFALCYSVLHKVRSKSSLPPVEDTCYTRTRWMLSNLGLQSYENNFKKNLLTDNVLPLLKERQVLHLVTAGIPLGPRIKILNHIERCREAENSRGLKANLCFV